LEVVELVLLLLVDHLETLVQVVEIQNFTYLLHHILVLHSFVVLVAVVEEVVTQVLLLFQLLV
tara:strand:- start:610 stop:798 length:189 start_codon:yes stop_codon:yes gene_type:complete